MFTTINADTGDDLWLQAVARFREGDAAQQASRCGNTDEILHAALCLRNPRERWAVSRYPALNPAFSLVEVIWILRGRRDSAFPNYFNSQLSNYAGKGEFYHGAYGYRLRGRGDDQMLRAYEALKSNGASRQVVLQIWDSQLDLPAADGSSMAPDIPCNICALLKIRDGRLEWTQIMRSNDMHIGLPYNLVQFTSLQEVMAGWLNVGIGDYHHLSDSLHIYDSAKADVMQANQTDAPRNCDSLGGPFEVTELAAIKLENLIEKIIDQNVGAKDLKKAFDSLDAPEAWRNIGAVVAAEGLRKRRALTEMAGVIGECTNALFCFMFERWRQRVEIAS